MTTIAFRAKIFAADSCQTVSSDAGGTSVEQCEKLFRFRTGGKRREVVVATAGGSELGMVFVDWLKRTGGAGAGDPPVILRDAHLEEDFTVLVWDRGRLYTANHLCRLIEVVMPYGFTAIGCGRKAALGALMMGASAHRAVQVAAAFDPYTRAPIRTMRVR
jgi:hypothetical protein